MARRLSIFHPPGELALRPNPFGKDVANLQLFRALARHGGFEQLDILSLHGGGEADLARALVDGAPCATRLTSGSILGQATAAEAGALLRGQPDLYDLAWLRRRTVGDRAYSLLGLVHTIAPPTMRQIIAMAQVGPVHPWDAIVCTSPSVRENLASMFEAWGDHLAERTGGKAPPRPALPIVPLGVDGAALAEIADRPGARDALRAELGLAHGDILVLWVGRLSFFEKAFPQPMFQAVQQAARATGVKVHFAMAGWFPQERDPARYSQAAKTHAPDVTLHLLDGNDRVLLDRLWAGSDIFLSLVDNIQETFGITPLEAMAAGLPVVASDWDGYRATIRDGVEGFLVPTLGGPAGGLGPTMLQRQMFQVGSYQSYVGEVAQHTAVSIPHASGAIAELIRSPDLRRTMGAAGRARVKSAYDWPVAAGAFQAVLDELAQVRAASADPVTRHQADPVRGDPFADFAGFASGVITLDTPLSATANGDAVRGITGELDKAFPGLRATPQECAQALDLVASGGARNVRQVLQAFPQDRRKPLELGLMWLAKLGLIDWRA